ncbi:MAG: hypothetical protein E6J89_12205 [Deltaproteobacteria bacterium]|nr:MAG: hypothetical protein E6J89_12205 [Deltaproteobacteria bacterium]
MIGIFWIGALLILSLLTGATRGKPLESPSAETRRLVEQLKGKISSGRLDEGEEVQLTLKKYRAYLSVCYRHTAPDRKSTSGCYRDS